MLNLYQYASCYAHSDKEMNRMISINKVYRDHGGPVCRSCLNTMTKAHLRRKNCWYAPYPGICPRCQVDNKNLVVKLKLSGKLKTLLW